MYWIALQAQPEAQGGVGAGADHAGSAALADAAVALGWWALQFTPKVAIVDHAVVLEVSASERLFGGRQDLLDHIFQFARPIEAAVRSARGSTALVALARLQLERNVARARDQLPLAALADARPHLSTLERLGCRAWGDVRALPRPGVARRFGAELLDALDRAYGLKAEVYPWLVLPDVFDMPLELADHVEAAPALVFAACRLLSQLKLWLQARKQGIVALELEWRMDARRHTATYGRMQIRTAEPTLDMNHMQRLLAENLARITLPAPVVTLCLRSIETADLPGENASLLADELRSGDSLHQLLERLSARLGPQQVLHAVPVADHRPECRQEWVAATQAPARPVRTIGKRKPGAIKPAPQEDGALYPTWLLAHPLKLLVRQDRPHYQGPLTLLAGPHRLETGWWDVENTADANPCPTVLRDYFLAGGARIGLVWIYRERLPASRQAVEEADSHWYLHGLFG